MKEFNKIICPINNDHGEYWCICRLLNMFVEKNNLDVVKLVANELKNYSDIKTIKKTILKAYSQNNIEIVEYLKNEFKIIETIDELKKWDLSNIQH